MTPLRPDNISLTSASLKAALGTVASLNGGSMLQAWTIAKNSWVG